FGSRPNMRGPAERSSLSIRFWPARHPPTAPSNNGVRNDRKVRSAARLGCLLLARSRPPGSPALLRHADQHLAEVAAFEEADEAFGGALEAVEDGLLGLDLAGLQPGGHLGREAVHEVGEVAADEAFHAHAGVDHAGEVLHALALAV